MPRKTGDEAALEGQMEDCIQDCLNCHTVCLDTAMRELQKAAGQHSEHIRTLLDCSEICATAAHFMIRNSSMHGAVCQVCADVCTHCAEICEADSEMDCANACRASATSCQQMVKMIA